MDLLKKYRNLSPIYQGGLTNHLPMMITALEEMNVANPIIEDIAYQYVEEKSIPLLSDKHYPHSEFEDAYIDKTNIYSELIKTEGRDTVIKEFFKVAEFSLSSGLFHGLIRLYFAVQSDNDLYISQALSYFELIASSYIINGVLQEDTSPFETLVDLRKNSGFEFTSQGSMSKLNELLKYKKISNELFYLDNIEDREAELLELFVSQYIKSRDFYVLHVITGFHALVELKGYFKNYDEVLKQFFLVAQTFMLFNDYLEEYDLPEYSDFTVLKNRIIELNDAHDIKLFYTINKLYDSYKVESLKQVATIIFS